MNSLFLRMRLVHWIGIVLLIINAFFFTDNIISIVIQLVIAVVIVIHDIDEKVNGVNVAKKIINSLGNFNSVMSKIEKGEGSIGKLINDAELYNNLEGASKELEELLRDLKENPKRYMHFSLFGKKNNEYEPSEVENN